MDKKVIDTCICVLNRTSSIGFRTDLHYFIASTARQDKTTGTVPGTIKYQHDPGNVLIGHAGPACDEIKSKASTYK